MNRDENQALATIRAYFMALETGASGETIAGFFTPDAAQIELPNLLNPKGGTSDLATMCARAEKGRRLLTQQRYEVLSMLARDKLVAVEVRWSGTLAVAMGKLAAGAALKAHIAMFFEMKGAKIYRQRNYDCFEAW